MSPHYVLSIKKIVVSLCLALFVCNATFSQNKDFKKVEQLMQAQSDCWNAGDIDGFMETYWKSDALQFIGSSGVTYGWTNTLEGYKKRYPSKDAMGHLTFDIINMDKRSRKVISVVGKWHLKRGGNFKDLEGHFLLILKKMKGKWIIVADHSS
ncbi:MAG: DUF4440 domain-containing protein [Bacteroidota bacterium]